MEPHRKPRNSPFLAALLLPLLLSLTTNSALARAAARSSLGERVAAPVGSHATLTVPAHDASQRLQPHTSSRFRYPRRPARTASVVPAPTPISAGANAGQFCTVGNAGWGAWLDDVLRAHPVLFPLSVGATGHSTTLRSAEALRAYLNLGGEPGILDPGSRDFSAASEVTADGGGSLAQQAAALTLAIYLSDSGLTFDGFAGLRVPDQPFCSDPMWPGADGKFGTTDDMIEVMSPLNEAPPLPAAVLQIARTPADLLQLANDALLGHLVGVSLQDVAAAVSALNAAFNNCRQIADCR